MLIDIRLTEISALIQFRLHYEGSDEACSFLAFSKQLVLRSLI